MSFLLLGPMPRTWSTSIVTHFDKRAFSTSQHKVPVLTDISISQELFPGTTCTSSSSPSRLSSLNRERNSILPLEENPFPKQRFNEPGYSCDKAKYQRKVKEPSTRLEKGIFFPGIRLVYSSGRVDTVRNCLLLL